MLEEGNMNKTTPIQYCPICGDDSTIDFIEETADHAEWICDACDERIEVYLTETEDDDSEERTPSHMFPFIIIIVILISYIYLTQ